MAKRNAVSPRILPENQVEPDNDETQEVRSEPTSVSSSEEEAVIVTSDTNTEEPTRHPAE